MSTQEDAQQFVQYTEALFIVKILSLIFVSGHIIAQNSIICVVKVFADAGVLFVSNQVCSVHKKRSNLFGDINMYALGVGGILKRT